MSKEADELFRCLVLKGFTLRMIRQQMEVVGHVLKEDDAPYIRRMINILSMEEGE